MQIQRPQKRWGQDVTESRKRPETTPESSR